MWRTYVLVVFLKFTTLVIKLYLPFYFITLAKEENYNRYEYSLNLGVMCLTESSQPP